MRLVYIQVGHPVDNALRALIRLPDGGTLAVDMAPRSEEAADLPADAPILVVQHGLTGGSYEPYVRSILAGATAPKSKGGLGMRAFVVNFRGCKCCCFHLISPQVHFAISSTGANVPFTSPMVFRLFLEITPISN